MLRNCKGLLCHAKECGAVSVRQMSAFSQTWNPRTSLRNPHYIPMHAAIHQRKTIELSLENHRSQHKPQNQNHTPIEDYQIKNELMVCRSTRLVEGLLRFHMHPLSLLWRIISAYLSIVSIPKAESAYSPRVCRIDGATLEAHLQVRTDMFRAVAGLFGSAIGKKQGVTPTTRGELGPTYPTFSIGQKQRFVKHLSPRDIVWFPQTFLIRDPIYRTSIR
jgi:hypothetical protein